MRYIRLGAVLAVPLVVVLAGPAFAVEMPGQAEPGDLVGQAVAAGDFDGDGFDDLAVGAPGEAIGTLAAAGAVTVVYGSPSVLVPTGGQLWSQDSRSPVDVAGVAEAGDRFGSALAAGDFDGDGFDDLAIGVPFEDAAFTDSGVVHVLYGSSVGLTSTGNQMWDQNTPNIEGDAETSDRFGSALASADFDGNGDADLAIGVPRESIDGIAAVGGANVIYGASTGLVSTNDDFWHQQLLEVEGDPESGDEFGTALAGGDFDGNGDADLAIGVPGESINGIEDVGGVNVLYGSSTGLTGTSDDFWHQDVASVEGQAESNDRFGSSLAAADFGRSTQADLAIGVPFEDVGDRDNAGMVNVLYGSSTGLVVSGDQEWHQDVASVEGGAESSDLFGSALAAGNLGKSGQADLAIGVRGEAINDTGAAGVVNVIYGTSLGLSVSGDELWHQDVTGIEDGAESSDAFGTAVAIGNFGGASIRDLAVGVPTEDLGSLSNAGAVNVIYGAVDGLSNTGDQLWTQGIP